MSSSENACKAAQRVRVNIGCGTSAPEGWVNLDNSPTIVLSRIPLLRRWSRVPKWPRNVRRHNVLRNLPFIGESVDVVYSSHTFEHFTFEQALFMAKECFRVLKPGGVVRIVVPDLEKIVGDYQADPNPLASHRMVERMMLMHTWQDFLHPGSHHSQMFDARSLTELLSRAGFVGIRQRQFGESEIAGVTKVDLAERSAESLYMEGRKAEAELCRAG